METLQKITRDQMNDIVIGYLDTIKGLFSYKNGNYGSDDDPMFNFRTAATSVLGNATPENMYRVLQVYIEKHRAALLKNGLDDTEFVERCKDEIVYTLISIAMKEVYDAQSVPKSSVQG